MTEQNIKKLFRETKTSSGLTINEEAIINDLLTGSLNEDFNVSNLLNKFKKYAKQGAITAGIVLSLLSSDAIGQEQKQEILNVAKTELSQEDIQKIKQNISKETGLEFSDEYIGNNFATVDKAETPALPEDMELRKVIAKAGIPSKYIDNIYINHVGDETGNDYAGVKISVRLKEEGNFKRLNQSNLRNEVYKRIVNALSVYKPGEKRGVNGSLTLSVLDPEGNIINNRPLHFKG